MDGSKLDVLVRRVGLDFTWHLWSSNSGFQNGALHSVLTLKCSVQILLESEQRYRALNSSNVQHIFEPVWGRSYVATFCAQFWSILLEVSSLAFGYEMTSISCVFSGLRTWPNQDHLWFERMDLSGWKPCLDTRWRRCGGWKNMKNHDKNQLIQKNRSLRAPAAFHTG